MQPAIPDHSKASTIVSQQEALGRIIERANKLIEDAQWESAESVLSDALRSYPQAVKAYELRGDVRFNLGRLEGAAEDLSMALHLGSRRRSTAHLRGVVNLQLGRLDAAISDGSRLLARDGHSPFPYLLRGVSYLRKRDYEAAVDDFLAANEVGEYVRRSPYLGYSYFCLGRFADAAAVLTEGISRIDYDSGGKADPLHLLMAYLSASRAGADFGTSEKTLRSCSDRYVDTNEWCESVVRMLLGDESVEDVIHSVFSEQLPGGGNRLRVTLFFAGLYSIQREDSAIGVEYLQQSMMLGRDSDFLSALADSELRRVFDGQD